MRVHFIAIGGSAMHNLAIALHKKGYQITGSDDAIFDPSKSRLEKYNLLPNEMGWFPEKITTQLDSLILGMHAKKDNPELLAAQELGLKIYSYPEFLFEQSKLKSRVVIGGSHGKTTITSMILHVLNYHEKEVDYMVGAQLEGFETMVHLTEENDFIVLEGDEYLSSPIDLRPKFHLYEPNIALLSGIAWDHINVFKTLEDYEEQFRIFINKIKPGGILVYNEEDETVKRLVEETQNPIRKIPYFTPKYIIEEEQVYIDTDEGPLPLEIFGAHNLNNLAGAKWICQNMGIDEADFYEAISSFKGASKRLEQIYDSTNTNTTIFKDFAHSPSKVKATTTAVKNRYKDRKIVACLELHTYSSLNPEFISQYKGALESADEAIVYFSAEALKIKKMAPLSENDIIKAFAKKDLKVFVVATEFHNFIYNKDLQNATLLLMSSGNYGGLNFSKLK